ELVEHCLHEIHAYQLGETNDGRYCVELFRRAMGEHDPLAWEALQQCVHEMMVRWIRVHPLREVAYRFENEVTCSITVVSNREKFFASALRSSATSKRSTAYAVTSLIVYNAMLI